MSKYRFDNMDASESAFFSRQLEHIRPGLFEVQFGALKAVQFLPVNTQVHVGAEEFTYRWFESYGKAKLLTDYSAAAPAANVKAFEATSKIRGAGASYRYSMQEARAAMMAGLDLDPRKARAARRSIAELIDDVLLLGDGSSAYLGMTGFFALSGTQTYSTPNGTAGDTEWSTKTPDEIVADLNGIADRVVDQSKEVEKPDTLILPLSSYNYIATRRMGDGSDMTILNHFKANSQFVRSVLSSTKLETAGSGGVKRMVAYERSPDKVEAILPVAFEQLPPQQEGYEIVTHCHARCGGVVAYFPKSICYADSI